ncbi:hypothetical protein TNCV_2938891 [Trichonephila clavipes]|nr:hypothetical protein TNCV_2938891 [Trichonephila clavipes]
MLSSELTFELVVFVKGAEVKRSAEQLEDIKSVAPNDLQITFAVLIARKKQNAVFTIPKVNVFLLLLPLQFNRH